MAKRCETVILHNIINGVPSYTYHKVPNDHRKEKERNALMATQRNAHPHVLNPFTAQNPKDDHERMQEVLKAPSHRVIVGAAEQLHSHDGEDEDDDGEDEAEVTEGTHRSADDADQ